MKSTALFLLPVFILLVFVSAGCLSGSEPITTTAGTPLPTQIPETPPPTAEPIAVSLAPGPTQTLPPQYYVEVQVEKQNQAGVPTITVTFRGGTGMAFTEQVNIQVTRSDGVVETATMYKPKVGDERNLKGTANDDRVEVSVLVATGDSYTIYDALVPYQSINP